jgi:glycine/D-amino acid oxidase-like deaminating enzyme
LAYAKPRLGRGDWFTIITVKGERMPGKLDRRELMKGAASVMLLAGLQGCQVLPGPKLRFSPVRASLDRVTRITVCTRPFRAAGPRVERETVGEKWVVHNYGHGGSGWSLSWGSSSIAIQLALASGERDIGVLGCGALGLTSALLLQRAGATVTIYAKDLPPNVRSSLATGVWSPDSRICLQQNATPAFKLQWERMARTSFQNYQSFLGLPGTPVEFIDNYSVSDSRGGEGSESLPDARPPFADLQRELIGDLIPATEEFSPGSHTLGNRYLRRHTEMMFNISAYTRVLLDEFHANGGRIQIREFHGVQDLAALPHKTLINSTGYGARDLFGDQSVTPVRGQLTRLIPQVEVNYGLFYKGVLFVPRRDGLVFQAVGENDYYGFDDATTVADRAESERAVNTIAGLFANA